MKPQTVNASSPEPLCTASFKILSSLLNSANSELLQRDRGIKRLSSWSAMWCLAVISSCDSAGWVSSWQRWEKFVFLYWHLMNVSVLKDNTFATAAVTFCVRLIADGYVNMTAWYILNLLAPWDFQGMRSLTKLVDILWEFICSPCTVWKGAGARRWGCECALWSRWNPRKQDRPLCAEPSPSPADSICTTDYPAASRSTPAPPSELCTGACARSITMVTSYFVP